MLAWIQKYSTPVIVAVLILVAALWVRDHTQQAVAHAQLQHYADSVAGKVHQDSVDALAREIAFKAQLEQHAEAEAAAKAFAQAAHTAMHAALDSLAVAKSAGDSIVAYQAAVAQDAQQITALTNAVTAADAQVSVLKAQVLDQAGQIATLRGLTQDPQKKLEKASHPSAWNSTTVTLVKTVLAAKGAYDVFRGH